MIVVGLLSGTSMDAIDTAVAELTLDGATVRLRPLGYESHPWPPELRARTLAALPPAAVGAQEICELDTLLGQQFAAAAKAVCAGADLIVSHGQTVCHWVEGGTARGTLQLGQPAWIAEATGLPVISDLRSRDIAAGGQGAPLAATLDALWLADGPRPAAALNLGGIANVTVAAADGRVAAFDTGPANCLIDVVAERLTGHPCDQDGRRAAVGTVRPDLLDRLLAEPYFALAPPKSTGRELFHAGFVEAALVGLPPVRGDDLLATLTELTAVTVAGACRDVRRVVASGGGVHNPTLLGRLRHHLGATQLVTSDELGLPADAKEAYLFALLGLLTWHQVPGVPAGPTGSAVPRVLGRLNPGDRPLRLPEPGMVPTRLVVEN
jgi:anhydro-N-acetylmuramic acid kinase